MALVKKFTLAINYQSLKNKIFMINVDDKILADIGRGFSVPAQPELLLKLNRLMAVEQPDINIIGKLISQDVAVSATILKTINSPIYGLARSISDIQKSVRYIGLNGIVSLVSNSLIKRSFDQNDCNIALDEFWNNATNIANTCVFIGQNLKKTVLTDTLFSLGLFHDCGIPVMAMKYNNYQKIIDQAIESPNVSLTTLEDNEYKVNHATIGYYVASSWRLPKDLCQLILSHHDRHFLDVINNREQQVYIAILKMAENIVHNHKHLCDAPDWFYLQENIFTLLEIEEEDYLDIRDDMEELHI